MKERLRIYGKPALIALGIEAVLVAGYALGGGAHELLGWVFGLLLMPGLTIAGFVSAGLEPITPTPLRALGGPVFVVVFLVVEWLVIFGIVLLFRRRPRAEHPVGT